MTEPFFSGSNYELARWLYFFFRVVIIIPTNGQMTVLFFSLKLWTHQNIQACGIPRQTTVRFFSRCNYHSYQQTARQLYHFYRLVWHYQLSNWIMAFSLSNIVKWKMKIMGRVAWLILLVVVSVCVVFCILCFLQNNPVFLSVTISHILKKWKLRAMFFGGFLRRSNYDQKSYDRKKGWPDDCTFFFFGRNLFRL